MVRRLASRSGREAAHHDRKRSHPITVASCATYTATTSAAES